MELVVFSLVLTNQWVVLVESIHKRVSGLNGFCKTVLFVEKTERTNWLVPLELYYKQSFEVFLIFTVTEPHGMCRCDNLFTTCMV